VAGGGKRVGAGRPAKLDFAAKLAVGMLCEKHWQEAIERSILIAISDLKTPAIDLMQAETKSIPVWQRAKWIKDVYEKDGYTLRDDANYERRELLGVNAEAQDEVIPFLVTSVVPKRPKGIKAAIVSKVTTETGAKFPQLKITSRFVQTCWNEARAFNRRLYSEEM
jgi:hypothetical protein